MKVMFDFFFEKSILVTGHNGFKGSWLVATLKSLGAHTIGISNGTSSSEFYLQNKELRPDIEINLDLGLSNQLRLSKELRAISGIFHLAAQSLVQESYILPYETFRTNILGTANLLNEYLTLPNLEFFLIATTDKVYKSSGNNVPYIESDDLHPGDDPYSASKVCVEFMVESWKKALPANLSDKVLVARAGNVIGGGDLSAHRLVPDIMKALRTGDLLEIRNPSSIRPWQHVLDPIAGYLTFAASSEEIRKTSSVLNFGPSNEKSLSVLEVVNYVRSLKPQLQLSIVTDNRTFGKESMWLHLNSQRALQVLGWKSQLSPYEAIDWTLEWHEANVSGRAPEVTRTQMIEYLRRINSI